jgi:hypothetical protein
VSIDTEAILEYLDEARALDAAHRSLVAALAAGPPRLTDIHQAEDAKRQSARRLAELWEALSAEEQIGLNAPPMMGQG